MNYRVVNHRIEVEDPEEENKFIDYCEEIRISKVITDLLTGVKTAEITIYAFPDTVTFEIPIKDINRYVLSTLIGYGLTVVDDAIQTGIILKILQESKENAIYEYRHNRLGFCNVADKEVFLLHTPIGDMTQTRATSVYAHPERTAPQGTFESWMDFVQAEIIGNENLELAMAIGAMPPVVHMLREDHYISLVPIIALIGKSSTGKTCALKTMAHFWGSCDENTGLLMDLNCTQTAFFEQISDLGMPALIDETSAGTEFEFKKIAYHLPKGKGRLRCNSDGTLKKIQRFSGVVVFTGETSLVEQCSTDKRYQGIHARILELTLPWTKDEYHAERLEYGCKTNCGVAAPIFITWLMANRDKLPLKYGQYYENLKSRIGECDGIEDRLLKICAVILVAAKAFNCSLGLKLNIKAMMRLLTDVITASSESRKDPKKLFDKLKKYVLDNSKAFPSEENSEVAMKVFGARGKYKHHPCFWIRDDIFEDFLSNNGVTDILDTVRTFNANGWLGKRSDRGYRIRKEIAGVKESYYCLYLNESEEKEQKKKEKKASDTVKNKSQMHYLLDVNDD